MILLPDLLSISPTEFGFNLLIFLLAPVLFSVESLFRQKISDHSKEV